jgi:hypothetical protein
MINITNEEYKALVRAQGNLEIIKAVIADEENADYRKVEIIKAVVAATPQVIPFNDPNEKEELF